MISAFILFVCKTTCDHLFRLNNSQTTVTSVLHSGSFIPVCARTCMYCMCVKFGVSLQLCEDF